MKSIMIVITVFAISVSSLLAKSQMEARFLQLVNAEVSLSSFLGLEIALRGYELDCKVLIAKGVDPQIATTYYDLFEPMLAD